MNDLQKLFVSELKDIYDGEHQLVKALGELEQVAVSADLKSAFHEHLEQTRGHINRLERVFEEINEQPKGKPCYGLEGIIDEGQMMSKEFTGNTALDAAAQKTENYEITSYGSLCSWAEELGYDGAADLLKQNLTEKRNPKLVQHWVKWPATAPEATYT